MPAVITPETLLGERYLTKDRIGQGGFSVVWSAVDQESKQLVALKIFAPNQGLEQTDIRQFELEKEKSDRLHHPRLIKILDYFKQEDSPCLVMPFMSNGSLYKKIKRGLKFNEKEIAVLLSEVADGLNYLHQQGMVHLDIKPDNILFDEKDESVLSDFGISADMRSTLMHASKLQGQTFNYNSPERFRGAKRLTEAVDIFALGVTVYEMVDGLQPDTYSIGMEVYTGRPKPQVPKPEYSNRFEQLVHACWNEQPHERPTASKIKEYADHYIAKGFWPEIKEYKKPEPATTDGRATEAIGATDYGRGTEAIGSASGDSASGKANIPNPTSGDKGFENAQEPKKNRAAIWWAGGVAATLLLGFFGYKGWNNYQSNSYLEIAEDQLGKNYLKSSFEFTQKALAVDPENTHALDLKNRIAVKAGELYNTYIEKAGNYLSEKRYENAREEIRRAQDRAGQFMTNGDSLTKKSLENVDFSAARDSGDILLKTDRAKALSYFEKANSITPNDPYILNKLDEIKGPAEQEAKKAVNKDLVTACQSGNYDKAVAALDNGANPNATGANGSPAISWAIVANKIDIVKLLVSKGADPNYRSGYLKRGSAGMGSPAIVAGYMNRYDILRYLIETCGVGVDDQEYDMNTKRRNGWTPLGAAASQGNLDIVKYLAGRGASINIRQGADNVTPMMEAAYYGHYDVVNYLVGRGASKSTTDKNGYDACYYAALGGRSSIQSLLGCSTGGGNSNKLKNNSGNETGGSNSNKNKTPANPNTTNNSNKNKNKGGGR